MKPVLIAILSMGVLTGGMICFDIFMGTGIKEALINAINPFRVMELVEFFLLFLLSAILLLKPVFKFVYKKMKQSQPEN
ncbi:hypothetical protein [Pseudalkalibacillus caeni]|uniref:Uncharacterized protein n=1 Tax=Exobacillus caeni TaxID=2574798 RepID=A0A5R9F433_9BACL|nr:hypothetical protein [Pseudalkalibacillus caeni]TLS37106.1 hypothetical protein FCL54_11295 [Pseudalkalibacillus caeni]